MNALLPNPNPTLPTCQIMDNEIPMLFNMYKSFAIIDIADE
jgi:hypothetical protein